jgi:hypothetical protein
MHTCVLRATIWRDSIPKEAAKAIENQLKAVGAKRIQELSDSLSQNKRKKDVDYKGQQGWTPKTLKIPKRPKVPAGQESTTSRERSLSELTEVLQGLAVVTEEKQTKRVNNGSQNEAPLYIPNSIPQPNET